MFLFRLKIGNRLTLSFVAIVLLMAAGYAVALWQIHLLRFQEEKLDRARQKSESILTLNAHLSAFRDKLEDLAETRNKDEFVGQAARLCASMLRDVEHTKQALSRPPLNNTQDPFVIEPLEVIESAVPVQIEIMSDLARAGDWSAIRLRSQNQVKQLSSLAADLVNNVAAEVNDERTRVLANIQSAERRAVMTLIGTCMFTLLVAATLGLAVTHSIIQPLVTLDRAAEAFARGDFLNQVIVRGNDELAHLADVFNRTRNELRRLYETLRESEARFRALIEHSSDVIVVLDSHGTILYLSPSSNRVLALDPNRLIGQSILPFIHRDDVTTLLGATEDQAPNLGRTFEFRFVKEGEEPRVIEAVLTNSLTEPAVGGLVINARDVTQRKRAEEELARSEAFLAEGEALSHTGSWAWNLSKLQMTWSSEQFRILGSDPSKIAPSIRAFLRRVHSEDRRTLRQLLRKAEDRDVETEFRVILPNGGIRYVHSAVHAVADSSGRVVELIGTSMDITGQKRSQDALQQAHAELAHVLRAATMGELTASIAHEVSQPLTAVIVNATAGMQWLAADPPNLDAVRESLTSIAKDGKFAGSVVSRIRSLIKKSPPGNERVDIKETILEVIALAGGELRRRKVSLETQFSGEAPLVFADRVQLQQVILNLIVNAAEAMSMIDGPRDLLIAAATQASGNVITVCDSGPGLQSVDIPRIFEPFYSTKPAGMGMGLAISRSIIEAHGGQLSALTNPGRGATFRIVLPAAEACTSTQATN